MGHLGHRSVQYINIIKKNPFLLWGKNSHEYIDIISIYLSWVIFIYSVPSRMKK